MTLKRILPQPTSRDETGPIQFGDDWPVVFIRGDDCAYYSLLLDQIMSTDTLIPITLVQLNTLKQLLSRAIING
jgi:hypothetical protein